MIRCLVVDDEAYALDILADYIRKVPYLTLAGTTTSPVDALAWVQQGRVDVVFLDIQMPELTGLQFLKLAGTRCKVVLTTAYPEYALQGYEHDAVDYLLKPVAFERFLKAAQKVLALQPAAAEATPTVTAAPAAPAYLFVKGETKNKYLRIDFADILYVEGLKNYVALHLPGRTVVTYQSLKELALELPSPPFLRVHKSYIVSLDKVRLVDGHTLYVQDRPIPLGETYREPFYRLVRAQ